MMQKWLGAIAIIHIMTDGTLPCPQSGGKNHVVMQRVADLNLKDKHKAFPVALQFTRSGGTYLQQINLFTTLRSTENVVPANQIALKARFDLLQSAET